MSEKRTSFVLMKKLVTLLLLTIVFSKSTFGALDTLNNSGSHLRISLLTCGVGEEVYETFGHTAIRVVDSSIAGPLGDIVYNYGMFNGYEDNFELKFMRGKLNYYVATELYSDFLEEYAEYGRSVEEQVLQITPNEKEQIVAFLRLNAMPENRNYKYDFFFDNCATRIRDVFPEILGPKFVYGTVIPPDEHISFRNIINVYFYRKHWERVGVNLLLGSKIDRFMSDKDIMFLPDYLRDGLAGAKIGGQLVALPAVLLLNGSPRVPAGVNEPLLALWLLFGLMLIGLTVKRLKILGIFFVRLVLFVSGLLGCLIVVMWFFTDHQGCSNNYNLLWLLPTNLILAFSGHNKRSRYAFIGIVLLLVAIVLHLIHVQQLIAEFVPLMLAVFFAYAYLLRYVPKSKRDAIQGSKVENRHMTHAPVIKYGKYGSGPAVVLIHGFPDDSSIWNDLSKELSKSNTVIVPDLPGVGNTALEGRCSIAEMALGIKEILDHEKINKVVIAGHSMGGYVALALAAANPELIAGLSLIHSTPLADDDEKKENRRKAISVIRGGGKKQFIKQLTINLFSESFVVENLNIVERKAELGSNVADESLINYYEAMMNRPELTSAVTNVSYPVQWVMGKMDKLINYQKLLPMVSNSSVSFLSLYGDCGHISMIEKPEKLKEDMAHFIQYCYRSI